MMREGNKNEVRETRNRSSSEEDKKMKDWKCGMRKIEKERKAEERKKDDEGRTAITITSCNYPK